MYYHDVWTLAYQTWNALQAHYHPALEQRCIEQQVDPPLWGTLVSLRTHEPDAVSVPDLMVRSPFTSADVFRERLRAASDLGLVQADAEGRFKLTGQGSQVTDDIIRAARGAMVAAGSISPDEMSGLSGFLGRIIRQCLETPPPPNRWSIRLSYRLMPDPEPAMPYIEQALTCLAAYRDDAHHSAWRLTKLSATALEVLTLFWRGEVSTFDQVCRRLANRGHDCQVYESVVRELLQKGYLEGNADAPWVTATGRVFRNQIEEQTDHYFFAPWSVLDNHERAQLQVCLEKLKMELETERDQAGGA